MTEDEAFLQAILKAPDADAPRLTYADWLEERGDPRAEFIRVQCGLAQTAKDDPRRQGLEVRELLLLNQYAAHWAESLRELGVEEWAFDRGFIEKVQLRLEVPAETILEVTRRAPVRQLRATNQLFELDELVQALPHLENLTGLELWQLSSFDQELLRVLVTSPHLGSLRTLVLYSDRNGSVPNHDVLRALLTSPYRIRLTELNVGTDGSWRGLDNDLIVALANAPHLAGLRRLTLSCSRMDPQAISALVSSPLWENLTDLDLGRCEMQANAWRALLEGPRPAGLSWLRLCEAMLVDEQGIPIIGEHDSHEDGAPVGFIQDKPEWRAAFEARYGTGVIDWETEWVDPWNCDRFWYGHTWRG